MDLKSMENLLWKAACSIRGEKDAPKFKDYILPLLFIKRLSDVFEDELARLVQQFGDEATARTVLDADHSLVRFYLPPEATWPVLSGRQPFDWPEGKRPRTLGEQVTTTIRTIAKANLSLQGVIDLVGWFRAVAATGYDGAIAPGAPDEAVQACARRSHVRGVGDPRERAMPGVTRRRAFSDAFDDGFGRAHQLLLFRSLRVLVRALGSARVTPEERNERSDVGPDEGSAEGSYEGSAGSSEEPSMRPMIATS
jgi:hypothetical protein